MLLIAEEPVDIDLPDPKDRVFYEVTMEARKDEDAYLLTLPLPKGRGFLLPAEGIG